MTFYFFLVGFVFRLRKKDGHKGGNLSTDTKIDVSSHEHNKRKGKGEGEILPTKLRITMKRIDQLQSKAISQWRHYLVVVGLVHEAYGYSLYTTMNLLKPRITT